MGSSMLKTRILIVSGVVNTIRWKQVVARVQSEQPASKDILSVRGLEEQQSVTVLVCSAHQMGLVVFEWTKWQQERTSSTVASKKISGVAEIHATVRHWESHCAESVLLCV